MEAYKEETALEVVRDVECQNCGQRFKQKCVRVDLPTGYYTHGFVRLCEDCDEENPDLYESIYTDLVAECCAERGLL